MDWSGAVGCSPALISKTSRLTGRNFLSLESDAMPRTSNFHYSGDANLGASLGQSLGRALFGDPAAAAEQRQQMAKAALMAAQTGEATSHGQLYANQATGQGQQNQGSMTLAELLRGLKAEPAPPMVMPSDDLAPRPEPVYSRVDG